MEEEEARLKALLEQTEDFDERRKIRADLRVVRKKMLDSISATAEAESNERAARRAERARARKTEEGSNHTGPAITDQILAEIDDEDTLQKLLEEIPTSQIEDRRRIRARIREVKRKKAEEEEPAPRRARRTRDTTETSEETSTRDRRRHHETASDESTRVTIETKKDEPSSVTIETTLNEDSHVTIETTSNEASHVAMETTSDEPSSVSRETKTEPDDVCLETTADEALSFTVETNSDDLPGVSIDTSGDDSAVTIETTSATTNHVDDGEIKFKLTLRQSKDIRIEQDTENMVEQSSSVEIDRAVEVPSEEPIGTPVEIRIEHDLAENHNEGVEDEGLVNAEDHGNDEEHENPEAVSDDINQDELPSEEETTETQNESLEKINGEIDAGESINGISVQLKIDGEVDLNNDMEDDNQIESNQEPGGKEPTNATDTEDGGKISKDSTNEAKPSKKAPGSQFPPPDDDKKKHGRVNQVDFRNNLKKSGKIGQSKGMVNLEKKNNTTGAQVDFRAGSLKKSGRIGAGTVNLENKISTQGAQVDFRGSSLKPSGKIGTSVVHLERKTTTAGAQVDFRAALKKGGGGSPVVKSPVSNERKGKSETPAKKIVESKKPTEETEQPPEQEIEEKKEETATEDNASSGKEDNTPAPKEENIPTPVEKKIAPKKDPKPVPAKKDKSSETTTNYSPAKTDDKKGEPVEDKKAEVEELSPQIDIKLDVNIETTAASPAPSVSKEKDTTTPVPQVKDVSPAPVGNKEASPATQNKQKEVAETKGKNEFKYKPRDSYKTRDDTKPATAAAGGSKNKLFEKLSKFQAKDETVPKPKTSTPVSRSQKKEAAPAADKAVNGIAIKVENTSIKAKEPESPVQIEVSEHVEDDGDTATEVKEVKTTKQDGDEIEEKTEVTTTSKTTTPGGGKFTTQTKETTTKTTTRKPFTDPELQKRMASRQRERVAAKREQASSAKNKRMAFMQKLEANSPAQKGPSNVKRSGSNVDKLLAWCRFKLRDYEGVKLTNFSSSWGDGLAFCALIHLYLPDKIPYDELVAGGDKRRNFEVAFGAATEAGVPELLEVDDMLTVANPEPKSVMTYVSSIYKHFNPS